MVLFVLLEIIKTLSLKEYLTAFLEKGLRYDKRSFNSKRSYSYQSGVLDSLPFSASCTLGNSNKVIAVLKMKQNNKGNGKISSFS
jgi:exosome complex RNA-binding protein Rrp42 (RNase PH superfamily)